MHILLADDHILFRDALDQFVKAIQPDWTMTQVSTLDEAMSVLDGNPSQYDLVLLDFRMPGMNGLNGLKHMVDKYPEQKISIISGVIEESTVHEALEIGVCAYFPKTLKGRTLVKAIELVLDGQRFIPFKDYETKLMPAYYDDDSPQKTNPRVTLKKKRDEILKCLTQREQDVINHLAMGLSNKEIAQKLDLQIATVKLHVSSICKKMNANNRTKATVMAHQIGLIPQNNFIEV
jgi:DNA-binding NarL/FixJ family response regulator